MPIDANAQVAVEGGAAAGERLPRGALSARVVEVRGGGGRAQTARRAPAQQRRDREQTAHRTRSIRILHSTFLLLIRVCLLPSASEPRTLP